MTKKLPVAICLILLLGAVLLGAGLLGVVLLGGSRNGVPGPTPAPYKDTPQINEPAYGLPLKITIEGVPEVPKEIRGPSPPIEEKEQ